MFHAPHGAPFVQRSKAIPCTKLRMSQVVVIGGKGVAVPRLWHSCTLAACGRVWMVATGLVWRQMACNPVRWRQDWFRLVSWGSPVRHDDTCIQFWMYTDADRTTRVTHRIPDCPLVPVDHPGIHVEFRNWKNGTPQPPCDTAALRSDTRNI